MAEPQLHVSAHFAEWLGTCEASLALVTGDANQLVVIGRHVDASVAASGHLFSGPTCVSATPGRLTLATRCRIWELENVLASEETYQGADQVYVSRRAHVTGTLNIQDVRRGAGGDVVFVNTTYSCLATLSEVHSFRPVWTPPFISDLKPEDRCHLTGVAVGRDGTIRYATAVSRSDAAAGWKQRREGGIVMDVQAEEVMTEGLSVPYAPRLHEGQLYLVNGGTGELSRVSPSTGDHETVARFSGYARGLALYDGYAIVGVSKSRACDALQGPGPAERPSGWDAETCGVYVIDLETGECDHWLEFGSPIEEVCSVEVLPGVRRPEVVGTNTDKAQRLISLDVCEGPVRHLLPAEEASRSAGTAAQSDARARERGPDILPSLKSSGSVIRNTRVSADRAYRFHVGSMTVAELLERFEPLLPSRFRQQVRAGGLAMSERLAGVWTAIDDRPVGLAVASMAEEHGIANVVGLGVLPPHRGQGIGTVLLQRLEAVARDGGSSTIQARYRSTLSSVAALERVFEKREWDPPQVVRHLYRCHRDEVPDPFIDRLPDAASKGEIVDWEAVTAEDRQRWREHLQSSGVASIPRTLNPFQMEDRIEPRCSVALRIDGRVGGWMIVHRLADDVLQYTSLYVEPSLRGSDLGLVLLSEAIRRGLGRTDVSRFLWMVNADNEKVRRFSDAFLEPLVVSRAELLLVGKRLENSS